METKMTFTPAKSPKNLASGFLALALAFVSAFSTANTRADKADSASKLTALDRYIAKPDTNYTYKLVNTIKGDHFTTFILDMTSQSWLTTNEVNRTLWKHWVIVTKPDEVAHNQALLFISGGGNDGNPPKNPDGNMIRIAVETKSVVTELKMVPNQPLIFAGETKGRTEDSLIAYTWDKYLRNGDDRWPARLPMTKSAVRAMDTITAFCGSPEGGGIKVDQFVVSGGSKRGWTTWTTAAVDKRVVAIVPIVIDMLNIVPSFIHHYEAYGFWAPAVGDYEHTGIMDWTKTKEYAALMKIEEPYQYRDRLTMPKFIINAAGDQFFLPDSSQFYFDDLKGVKYLRYVANADHSLKGSDAWLTVLACYGAILNKAPLPQFNWNFEKDGSIRVKTASKPSEVRLWQATNPNARDFRKEAIGEAYKGSVLEPQADGSYLGKIETPAKGWTAFFVELTFPNNPAPFKFTTAVRVLPDVLPFKGKMPEGNPRGIQTYKDKKGTPPEP